MIRNYIKGSYVNWGGLLCISSGFFGIMVVVNHLLSNSENSGVYALTSLALAMMAVPFVLKVDLSVAE